eukprot:TRINITY_DN4451_c0_g1_i1.p1 TRINITY_DN4451_c0_g1~~TRINITY_DN4451_c0_g1_i1.p1  ORF type:complete len:533 (+),score=96.01 TRINITY_DN4451_c0_g1_i1:107-1705(+)
MPVRESERAPLLSRHPPDEEGVSVTFNKHERFSAAPTGPFIQSRTNSGPIGEFFVHHYGIGVVLLFASRIGLSIVNRLVYKVMLVPMSGYEYFLSLFMSFVYVLIYLTLFTISYRAGWVTDQGLFSKYALGIPKKKLIVIGACDCFGSVIGIVSAAHVGGSILTVLSTLVTPFTMTCGFFYLRSRYNFWQLLAASVIIGGNIIIVLGGGGSFFHGDWWMVIVNVAALIPNAISFTVKESIFGDLPGINVLCINLVSSMFAVCFMPIAFVITNIPGFSDHTFKDIPSHVKGGMRCFAGLDPLGEPSHHHPHPRAAMAPPHVFTPTCEFSGHLLGAGLDSADWSGCGAVSLRQSAADASAATWVDGGAPAAVMAAPSNVTASPWVTETPERVNQCEPMPWPWVLYAFVNVAFNICILLVVKYGGGRPQVTASGVKTTTSGTGAVVNFLVGIVATAMTFLAFALPIFPHYAHKLQEPLEWYHWVGFTTAVLGLASYQWVSYNFRRYKAHRKAAGEGEVTCCTPFPWPWRLMPPVQ